MLNARGTLTWPKGEQALLDRVYTVRELDPAAGTISFDIFRHDGGRTSAWAEGQPLGETVGLMGPGGKAGPELPEGGRLLCGGDETALPALLRGIAGLPQGTRGRALLLVGAPEDRQPVPGGSGLDITWLYRSEGATEADLVAEIAATPLQSSNAWLWFAASQQAAREVRQHGREVLALPRERLSSIAYWQ